MESDRKPAKTPQHRPHSKAFRLKLIQNYRKLGRIDLACEASGIDRGTHYKWLREHESYRLAFNVAREEIVGMLADEAYRRAVHGVQKVVLHAGAVVEIEIDVPEVTPDGTPVIDAESGALIMKKEKRPLIEYTYSDRLLELLLKSYDRRTFGDQTAVSNPDGSAILTHAKLLEIAQLAKTQTSETDE